MLTAQTRERQVPAKFLASKRWQADLALALVALIWGVTFVVVKRALLEISTMYFLAVRFSIASTLLAILFARKFRDAGARPVLRGLRGGMIAGLFLWLGYVLQTFGLKYTSAGKSGFLTGLYIPLVPLISTVVYRRWPQFRELAGITIAAVGMLLLTAPSIGHQFRMNPGDALTIGCAVAFAFHLMVLGYFSQRERFEAVALGQIACAAIFSASFLFLESPVASWTTAVLFAILLTAFFATALAFALQTWAQQYTSATRTALIFALEPVFALAAAVAIGGEKFSAAGLFGAALILAGILAVELKPAPRE